MSLSFDLDEDRRRGLERRRRIRNAARTARSWMGPALLYVFSCLVIVMTGLGFFFHE